jgi:DNA-binding transcriptional LysR family regulator
VIDLRALRYFVTVAEELHFRRAGERLRIAQPALSKSVSRLERELGVSLLRRTKRRVELTPPGLLFLDEARRTLAQAERAVDVVQRAAGGEVGRLRIAFGPTSELGLLPEVLPVFLRRYPQVVLDLQGQYAWGQLGLLREGVGTVGLSILPLPRTEQLVVERLYEEPLVAALPAEHPLASRRRVSLRALSAEPFVMFSRQLGPGMHDLVVATFQAAGLALTIAHESTHLYTSLGLVAAGLGVSLMPRSIQNLQRSGVVYRPLTAPAPTVELGMVYRADDASPTVARFTEVVREVVRDRASTRVDRRRGSR